MNILTHSKTVEHVFIFPRYASIQRNITTTCLLSSCFLFKLKIFPNLVKCQIEGTAFWASGKIIWPPHIVWVFIYYCFFLHKYTMLIYRHKPNDYDFLGNIVWKLEVKKTKDSKVVVIFWDFVFVSLLL